MHVQYFPWASHRLADVFPDPHAFRPERMARDKKAKLPRGAYVPFGAGRRVCIGKRFGYLEAKVIASRVLQRFLPEVGWQGNPHLKWSATLMPKAGLAIRIVAR
jgi:cytochrome P450